MLIVMGIGIELRKVVSTRVSWLFQLTTLQNVQGDPVQSTSSSIWLQVEASTFEGSGDFTTGGLRDLCKLLSQLCR